MSDELNPTTPTTTTEPPATNTPEARTPTGELKDASGAPPAAPVVPDAYQFTAPEGTELDAAVVEKASPIFKELGLSQEQAQKLVDFYSAQTSESNKAIATAVENMRADWRSQIMSDKDIGGKIEQVKVELGRAKDRLPAEIRTAFEEAMNVTGMGDHPAIVKGLYEFAKLVNEGTHVSGGNPSPHGQAKTGNANQPTLAGALYPHLPH
jgi:hypothetical protein